MTDLFRFIGEDNSLGYREGQIYQLHVIGGVSPIVVLPFYCPYKTYEVFFYNWERV